MPLPILIILAFQNENCHVFAANRDILNRQSTNFAHSVKPSEANQENEKKTNNGERNTRKIMISDPTNCVDG